MNSDLDKMADLFAVEGTQPSDSTKARLTSVVEQNVTETGKLFRNLCQRSGSREVTRIAVETTSLCEYLSHRCC